MEFFSFLLMLALVLFALKILGFVIKAGIVLISIPLQILFAVILTLVVFTIFPLAALTGFVGILLAPLGILAGFLPIFLVIFGVYLLVRK